MQKFIAIILLLLPLTELWGEERRLPLAGQWSIRLDSLDQGEAAGWQNRDFPDRITLPGTTDEANYGTANTLPAKLDKPQLLHLTRRHSYIGPAWYTRTVKIPPTAARKRVILSLERVLWKSDVWIDGIPVKSEESNSLIAPHTYDISEVIRPGRQQRITIRIDNRRQFDISHKNLAHAYTDDTQTIWNGMIGDLSLRIDDPDRIERIAVYPDASQIRVKVTARSNRPRQAGLTLRIREQATGKEVAAVTRNVNLTAGIQTLETACPTASEMKPWNEFSPVLYTLTAELETPQGTSSKNADFGVRKLTREGQKLTLNGHPLFLRGTLECCIFPLTGYPPMEREGWTRIFRTAREWGLNHLRFHSWCPPQAAFEAADREGFYLQVELPVWSLTLGKDSATTKFLHAEARRLLDEYGNHPSFCFMSMGNELQGDMTVPNRLMAELKSADPRHLYTTTSFTFEKGYGSVPMPDDDFLVTQWTNDGWVRGQGVFNSHPPRFDRDFSNATRNTAIPIITHEIGQYSVYPDIQEIGKYTGVLRPLNFEAIRADLQSKGLLHKAPDYTRASGRLAAVLYKEEIERTMKTEGISGFQLLDLHDFPGQGTALVGLLNAFWENKGAITAGEFREFCAPVVPLARFAKAVYGSEERFSAIFDVSNYSAGSLSDAELTWSLTDDKGKQIAGGDFTATISPGYNREIGKIACDLPRLNQAGKLTLRIEIKNTPYRNHWNLWVYPRIAATDDREIVYTREPAVALAELKKGKKVLLNPEWKHLRGIEGKFVPVFWSPVHFPKQAATMGILCDPAHPALSRFPNDGHSDWQWWDLCINSTTIITDSIRGGSPIVEVIDNFVNNRRLAMIYEGRIGKGKLVIAACDLSDDLENRIAARQMRHSLTEYMQSEKFTPDEIENPDILLTLMGQSANTRKQSATSIY